MKKAISNFCIAAMVGANTIGVIFGEREGGVVISMIALTLLLFCLNIREFANRKYKKSFLLCSILILLFIIQILFHPCDIVNTYFLNFIIYGLPFLFLPFRIFSVEEFMKYLFVISFVALPAYATMDYGISIDEGGEYESALLMTTSYRILPLIISSLLYAFFVAKRLIIKVIAYCVSLSYIILFFVIGSRGAIIGLILFLLTFYVFYSKDKQTNVRRKVICIIALSLSYFFFEFIIVYIADYLASKGINFLFILRLNEMINSGAEMTGRDVIYNQAISEIWDSCFLGGGIGSFMRYNGTFPHNLFLQALIEGGIFFFIPILIVFLKSIKFITDNKTPSPYFSLLSVLLLGGVTRLLFSFYLWGSQFFWMLIWAYLYKKEIVDRNMFFLSKDGIDK